MLTLQVKKVKLKKPNEGGSEELKKESLLQQKIKKKLRMGYGLNVHPAGIRALFQN